MADTFPISMAILDWIERTIDVHSLSPKYIEMFYMWKNKKAEPTFTQLSDFSKHSYIPFGYLFMKEPPEENVELIEHRTINSIEFEKPSRNFMDTYHSMQAIQDWMEEYLEDNDVPKLEFVAKFAKNPDTQEIVDYMRNALDLTDTSFIEAKKSKEFNNIRKKISDLGVIVMQNGIVGNNTHRPLDLHEFRGFALLNDRAPLIFINGTDSVSGKVFTLLHEFAHILMGVDDLLNQDSQTYFGIKKEETIANAAAAEIILPKNVFRKAWSQKSGRMSSAEKIKSIADQFDNNEMLVARKAFDNKLISKNDYELITKSILKNLNKKRSSGGNFYRNQKTKLDSNFVIALNESVSNGETSYMDAFRLTNTTNKTFPAIVDAFSGGSL